MPILFATAGNLVIGLIAGLYIGWNIWSILIASLSQLIFSFYLGWLMWGKR